VTTVEVNPRRADMLITGATVVTPAGNAGVRDGAMNRLRETAKASIAVYEGRIAAVGNSVEVEENFPADIALRRLDAGGMLVTPALVDCHTHPIWAGSRAQEFARRLAGATYQQIMAEGGGITSTVRATRAASDAELESLLHQRLDVMHNHGTGAVEAKSGYGLSVAEELRHLGILHQAKLESPSPIYITCLGAHATPPEFAGNPDRYLELVINELLPAAAHLSDFVDVFCDEGAFTLSQAEQVLSAGKTLGLGLRVHADEFASLGAVSLAVEMSALSADHLHCTTAQDIKTLAESDTVAVLLPATSFFLREKIYAPARAFIDAGAIVAVASDFNPGSANCPALQSSFIHAALGLGMTPAEILTATTLNAAAALGAAAELGSLEEGKRADIALWNVPDLPELVQDWGINQLSRLVLGGEVYHANR
jgi:imidazolonepropionase